MTSPNHGPTSPNFAPPQGPEYIEGLPDGMQIARIDAFRQIQERRIIAAIVGVTDYAERAVNRADAIAEFDDMAVEFLKNEGIAESDPKFDEYKSVLLRYSIEKDGFSPREWAEIQLDPAGNELPTEREKVINALRVEFPDSLTTPAPGTAPTPPPTPTPNVPKTRAEVAAILDADRGIKDARTKVDLLRDQLADLSAKRQGKLFSRAKFKDLYTATEQQYQTAVNDLAKAELKAEKDAGIDRDDDQERLDAAFKLVYHFKELQQKSVDTLKGTKVSKFISFMTEGSMPVRILKGVGLGLTVGIIGGALTAATGGVAGGAIVGGAVTVAAGATRFARGFAAFDNKNGRGVDVVDATDANSDFNKETIDQANATGKSGDETIDLVNKHLMEKLEIDTKAEQRKRRKSTALAIGTVVAGSLVAEGVHAGIDMATSHYDVSKMNNWLPGQHHDHNGDTPRHDNTGMDNNARNPVSADHIPVAHEYNADALTMSNGEGFYQTFQDMGIPQKDWPDLLSQAGPKLHDMQIHGHPLAYKMPNGEWGLRMSTDGTFPKAGLDVISSTHDHMTSAIADHVSAPAAHIDVAPSDASVPTGGTGIETASMPINPGSIETVLSHQVVSPSDVSGNASLSQLTHVVPRAHADYLATKLNLRPTEWDPVKDYIASQTTQGRPLYGNVFNVTQNGVVEFKTGTVPPATLADIISHIPTSVRARLSQ